MKDKEQKLTAKKYNRMFCQIRDGLLEAIELEKNCGADCVPFDAEPDPSMDSPEHFAKRPPETAFIPAGPASRDAHGHRYGSELLELDNTMLGKLRQGEQLAVEINTGEYVLFIEYRNKGLSVQ